MSHIQASQGVNPSTFDEADLFAAYSEGGHTCIQVFFFRAGQNWGNRPYFPKHTPDMELPEILVPLIDQDQTLQVREMGEQTATAGAAGDGELRMAMLQAQLLQYA